MSTWLYHYFVEGECEKALIYALMHTDKAEYRIHPGKIDIFNVLTEKFSPARVMAIKKHTKLVFIYDTDVKKTEILEQNIDMLLKYTQIKESDIVFLQSVKTLEDEIVRACSKIDSIDQLFNTKGTNDFKKKFIKHSDIVSKLNSAGFSLKDMWKADPHIAFEKYEGDINSIIDERK